MPAGKNPAFAPHNNGSAAMAKGPTFINGYFRPQLYARGRVLRVLFAQKTDEFSAGLSETEIMMCRKGPAHGTTRCRNPAPFRNYALRKPAAFSCIQARANMPPARRRQEAPGDRARSPARDWRATHCPLPGPRPDARPAEPARHN